MEALGSDLCVRARVNIETNVNMNGTRLELYIIIDNLVDFEEALKDCRFLQKY